ncbi:MAG: hypothetical protein WC328_17450 [Kiritimatiellia bacterium]
MAVFKTSGVALAGRARVLFQNEIVDMMQGTGGIEAYIVPKIATNVVGRNFRDRGLLLTTTTSSRIVAHEIGHQCGWGDIYVSLPEISSEQVTGPVSNGRLPLDWNNGPGPEEYYPRGLQQASLASRLLMYGTISGGNDIPVGNVYGLNKEGVLDFIQTGVTGMDRTPSHND